MDLQQQIIKKIGVDILLHNSYGGWITALMFPYVGLWKALLVGSVIAVLKEIFDKYFRKTKFDWKDVIATVAGCIMSCIIITFLELL